MMSKFYFEFKNKDYCNKINNDGFKREVGERVRLYRNKKGWTQERLAQESQISSKYIYEIEVGNKGMSIMVLLKLIKALGVDANTLMGYAEMFKD